MEAGDGTASRVDREEQVMVMAECERTLRLEWIGSTAAAAAVSCTVCLENELLVGTLLVGKNLVFRIVVGHDEHRRTVALERAVALEDALCIGERCESSDRERDGQKARN